MTDYEMEERCSDCGTNLIFIPEDDEMNDHGEAAITCPSCLETKRTGNPEPDEDDVIGFIHDGETFQGSVMAIGHSGTIRVRGVGVLDIEPHQVIEILDRPSGRNAD